MPEYNAPLKDMRFVMHEVLKAAEHYANLGREDLNAEMVDAILEEGAKFTSGVVAPLNRNSDEEGCQFKDGAVTTPKGYGDAYQQYCENGWASMTGPVDYDGQGLPASLAGPFHEMLMSASLSFRIYSGLTEGSVLALDHHGTDQLKAQFLPKLISGEWAGTMCLTEPQAGTDLALLRTKAEPQGDGSYLVSGTKIFISGGEQDLTSNIIHLVLARLPDAPAGVRGISLFLVPKFFLDGNGNPADANSLSCGSIEHKMGIKGAATCVMNFDGAKGWLIGEENKGLACMFTMMNHARFQVGLQGLGIAEAAYQGAVRYAIDRLQSRGLTGVKAPELAADPIIVHPDVRRMLLTQKALVEGGRVLAYEAAMALDTEEFHPDAEARKKGGARAAFFIPIVKGFLTDISAEVSNHGVQVMGGHGYIREWGMEQLVRDGRITQLYEGTNGIQALDLIRRKVLGDKGTELNSLIAEIKAFCAANASSEFVKPVNQIATTWQELGAWIIDNSGKNPEEIGACSVDFMQFSAYALLAYYWARMAITAQQAKTQTGADVAFYDAKIGTAKFYFQRILPRANMHRECMLSGADNLFELNAEQF